MNTHPKLGLTRRPRAALALALAAACGACGVDDARDEEGPRVGEASRALGAPTRLAAVSASGYPGAPVELGLRHLDAWADLGSRVVFFVEDDVHGAELWSTDGTAAGTGLVRDLAHDGDAIADIDRGAVASLGGVAIVAARGRAWRTDGTPAGTFRLAENGVSRVARAGGKLYFGGGGGLFTTDGTIAGTTKLLDAPVGFLVEAAGALRFMSGANVWKTDGTVAGTTATAATVTSGGPEIAVGTGSGVFFTQVLASGTLKHATDAGTTLVFESKSPRFLVVDPSKMASVGGVLFFFAQVIGGPLELWKSDGGPATLVKAFGTYTDAGSTQLVASGDKVYFVAGGNARALWSSDGTEAGTVEVIATTGNERLRPLGAGVVFGSGFDQLPPTLGFTDGTLAGTTSATPPPDHGRAPASFVVRGGAEAIFDCYDVVTLSWGLCSTTGKGQAIRFATMPGNSVAAPRPLFDFAGKTWALQAHFAPNLELGRLIATDGTPAGTSVFAPPNVAHVVGAAVAGDTMVFLARNTASANPTDLALHASDGTAAGTSLVTDAAPDAVRACGGELVGSGGRAYFAARPAGATSCSLYAFDPATGLVNLSGQTTAPLTYFGEFRAFKGGLLFEGVQSNTPGLYFTDGQAVALLKSYGRDATVTASGAKAWFTTGDGLFSTDGTPGGTVAVAGVKNAENLQAIGEDVWYAGSTFDGTGLEPHRSDGTPGGTARVADVNTAPGKGSHPARFTAFGAKVVFAAEPVAGRARLYVSDGTEAGTTLLTDREFTTCGLATGVGLAVGGVFHFCGHDELGTELFTTDGTPFTETRWLDLSPGPASSRPTALFESQGRVFLGAHDGWTAGLYVADPTLPNPPPTTASGSAGGAGGAGPASSSSASSSSASSSSASSSSASSSSASSSSASSSSASSSSASGTTVATTGSGATTTASGATTTASGATSGVGGASGVGGGDNGDGDGDGDGDEGCDGCRVGRARTASSAGPLAALAALATVFARRRRPRIGRPRR